MMKKWCCVLIACIMTFSLAACGGGKSSGITGAYKVTDPDAGQYCRFNSDGTFDMATVSGSTYTLESGEYSLAEKDSIIFDGVQYNLVTNGNTIQMIHPVSGIMIFEMEKCKDVDFPTERSDMKTAESALLGTYTKEEGKFTYYVQFNAAGEGKWASKGKNDNEFRINDATYSIEGKSIKLVWGVGQLVVFEYDDAQDTLADIDMNRPANIGMYAYWTKVDDSEFAKAPEEVIENTETGEQIDAEPNQTLYSDALFMAEENLGMDDFMPEYEFKNTGSDEYGEFAYFESTIWGEGEGFYIYPAIGRIYHLSNIDGVDASAVVMENGQMLE